MIRISLVAAILLIASHAYAAEGPQERTLDKAIAEMQMHEHTNDAYADPTPAVEPPAPPAQQAAANNEPVQDHSLAERESK